MRRFLEALCQLVARVFFRRIEVVGLSRLPEGGLLLAPNHPNALIDPLFVVTQCPRPVSFLAKAPLFKTFLIRHFVTAFDCLPVYRSQDGHDTKKNRETLDKAREVLSRGGAIAIFPEGKSHHEPELARLKTGAARIALGGRAGGATVSIIPCGIFYLDKRTFRSDAALVYGDPIEVPEVELDENGEPPRDVATELTETLRERLSELVVTAESHDVLQLASLASELIRGARYDRGESPHPEIEDGSSDDGEDEPGELELERRLQRRLIEGYERLSGSEEVRALVERMARLDALYAHHGVDASAPTDMTRALPFSRALLSLWLMVLTAPLAIAGAVVHYPVYRLIGMLAVRAAKGHEDAVSTMKMLGGFLLFPAWWLIVAVVAAFVVGPLEGLGVLVSLPAVGYVALRFFEALPRVGAWTLTLTMGSNRHETLAAERAEIYESLLALQAKLEATSRAG